MDLNEMINIKSRFEILYETKLDDVVYQGDNQSILKDVILTQKYKEDNLFLAIEQGSGTSSRHTHIVLNPRLKNKARDWLIMEYPLLLFEIDNTNQTSVNTEKYEQKKQYNENFKEFIAPRLKSDEAMKIKKFGGKMKSYA